MQAGYHGVPVVGMPLFAEQPDNIAFAEDHGFGLPVSVRSKSLAKDVTNALHRVLREPSFAVSAARISTSMQARSSTPAEVAASEAFIPTLHNATLLTIRVATLLFVPAQNESTACHVI